MLRLCAEIKAHAPQAKIQKAVSKRDKSFEVELGSGSLAITAGHLADIPLNAFAQCGWDVVCGDFISVKTSLSERSSSLWYAKIGSGSYCWVEVAYQSLTRNPSRIPRRLLPGRDADLAAANVMHTWSLAHAPREIATEEEIDAFCQRWMTLLSQAATGG